ncbi:transcriptional regulator [Thalassobaculum fulvum]|uniref:Transcriptional regulator n=1 Tax=Thalassobaculum fulvum TaxID=1633335 RepID=A0A919CNR4_9PROT|nr:MarR family winged helix-turn-helix transcriptional regulator [Thalassobaculum fulvum]GHD45380.1 transcriptional regulator [Thalassobaculum fulvum]
MAEPTDGTGSGADTASIVAEMRCTGAALRRATRRVCQFYDDALRSTGLKLTQYSVLSTLSQVEQPSITDLADRLMMDRTTLTRNLGPLQKAGWVRLGRGGDARARVVELTPEGRRMLERARPVWREAELTVRDRLGTDGGEALRRLLADASAVFGDA